MPTNSTQSLMILIAGPYRSGTDDDPEKMAQNLRHLESVALPLYRAGHIPLIGEWLALPLLREAGSKHPGDAIYDEILYPIANRLITRCDAVLRLPGARPRRLPRPRRSPWLQLSRMRVPFSVAPAASSNGETCESS